MLERVSCGGFMQLADIVTGEEEYWTIAKTTIAATEKHLLLLIKC